MKKGLLALLSLCLLVILPACYKSDKEDKREHEQGGHKEMKHKHESKKEKKKEDKHGDREHEKHHNKHVAHRERYGREHTHAAEPKHEGRKHEDRKHEGRKHEKHHEKKQAHHKEHHEEEMEGSYARY